MPLAEAESLAAHAQSTQGLHVSSALHLALDDPGADRLALEDLAAWCEAFSPSVGLEEAERPDCLLLDVTGLDHLFGGEETLAMRVLQAFEQRGLLAQAAIADTVGGAWAAAHYACLPAAKTVASWSPPVIIPPGDSLGVVGPLPVAALRLPAATLDLLAELGLHWVEQLLALPRASLASRFGPLLAERLDQALGVTSEPIVAYHPTPEIEVEWELEHPTAKWNLVEYILQELLTRVATALAPRQAGVLQLGCRLESPPAEPVQIGLGLFRPSASAKYLQELLRLRLERVRLAGPVARVKISVVRSAPLECRQQEMFASDPQRDASRHLALLLDRLANRLERHAVLRTELVADAQPELAFRCRPWTAIGAARKVASGNARSSAGRTKKPTKKAASKLASRAGLPGPLERPLWIQRRPLPVEVVALAPNGPPVRFAWQGVQHSLAFTWGPERIETAWWRGRSIRRDYYRVETQAGNRFWLFRQRTDGRWFLQGAHE